MFGLLGRLGAHVTPALLGLLARKRSHDLLLLGLLGE